MKLGSFDGGFVTARITTVLAWPESAARISPPSNNNAPVSTQVSSHGGARVTEVWAFLSQAGQHGGDVGELLHDRAALSC